MKNRKLNYSVIALITALILVMPYSCKKDFDKLELASYPNNPEVFIDGFSPGLSYAAFGGSKVTAFDVDKDVSYEGTASMKFEVPDAGDPDGAYAGGVYYDIDGRNLSGYDALTFWAKASKSATLDIIGLGNDLGEEKYLASMKDVSINSNWKKYIIPIPDPSKLTAEKGMFYYSEGPEEGLGYTFWIDEVKFEKLGTIAHKQPKIFDGNDKVESAVNGLSIPIDGLSVSFNMPNGIDQSVLVAPAYFTFASSDNNVATVDQSGMVTVHSAGTAVITAVEGGIDAEGSLTVESSGEFAHAPTPTADSANVISVFSNAYTNVPVDYYNGYWEPFQTTLSADFQVDGDDVLYYTNLNFVGIQFTSPTIDATNMTHLHLDIWIPNAVDPASTLTVKVVDLGPDGAFGDPDPTITYDIPTPLVSQSWIGVDIDLSALSSKDKLAQIIFDNSGSPLSSFYLDNVYFHGDGGGTVTGPTEAAPAPPARDAADVISIYSDVYTNLVGTDFPDWGQATVVSDVIIAGDNTLKFAGLDFQGIQLGSSQDMTGMEYLHIDYWTGNSTALNAFLISTGPVETSKVLTVPTGGAWTSVDIPLGDFSPVDLLDVIQMKFAGSGDIYLDNIYFYTSGGGSGSEPAVAAPTPPSRDAVDVISLFSNAYTDEPVDTWSADWDDSDVEDMQVVGDDVKKYTFTNFAGIDFSSNKLDASAMTHFHLDIWTPDDVLAKSLSIKNVDFGGGIAEATSHILTVVHTAAGEVPALATGSWVSIDVPITAFTGDQTRSDLAQIVMTCNLTTLYIDNLYFYKTGGGSATVPATAAPTPTKDAADVISIYSDAYTGISGTDFNPGWGQSTVYSEESIEGNNTMLYTGLDYQGIALGSSQDVSGMEFLHIDYWTANSSALNAFLISTGPVETAKALTVPTGGAWTSVDIPLGDFSPVDLLDVIQMKFAGSGDIYLDNIYFYKTGGGSATVPATAAPTPTKDAADVISIYSDAYTGISGTDFNPGWGQSTVYSEESIEGNNTMLYTGLDYQGIALGSSQDVSGMEFLHIDYWTANSSALNAFLISTGPVEVAKALTVPTGGAWTSVDIPLGDYSPVDLLDVIQMKFVGNGEIYLDNIYFYKTGGGGTFNLSLPIDFEPSGYGSTWTWNVFENDSNPPVEFVSNPDVSGINPSATVAKITALQAGQPWVGCETAHGEMGITFTLDASNTTVKIMVYKSVISDVGFKFATPSGGAQSELKVANTVINQWEELTFDFSGYIGLGDTSGLDQIIIFPDFDVAGRTSDNVVYFDNITFE